MKKTISSAFTPIYKFIFPGLWISLFGIGMLATLSANHPAKWLFFAAYIAGTVFLAWLCFPLKQVDIEGSDLVISNFFRSIRVPIGEIHDVTENCWINIHPVCIYFQRPTDFGPKIKFMPAVRLFSFLSSHPIVAELKQLAASERSRNPR